jgi:hypothetical protein
VHNDIVALHRQIVTEDYRSFTGDGPGESWGRDISIKVIEGFAKFIPDMRFERWEVVVPADRIVVCDGGNSERVCLPASSWLQSDRNRAVA